MADGTWRRHLSRWSTWALDHPVVTTAVAAVPSASAQWWWITTHRALGNYGLDESRYLATALRLQRSTGVFGEGGLVENTLNIQQDAPLLPLLSQPFLGALGRTANSALALQPMLYLLTAVTVSAAVASMSGRKAALVSGLVCLGLPINIMMSHSYQPASAVTLFLSLAILALVKSERGLNRGWMVVLGVAIGAMLLSRTMTIAFLPGVALGMWIQFSRNRRVASNAVLMTIATVAIAGPWWFAQSKDISRYLFGYGYGDLASETGTTPIYLRPLARLGILMIEVRPALVLLVVIALVASLVDLTRWIRAGRSARDWNGGSRSIAAVACIVLVGFLVLFSSSNQGDLFQPPLVVAGLACLVAVAGRLRGTWRTGASAAASLVAALNLLAMTALLPFDATRLGGEDAALVLWSGTEWERSLEFADTDRRFRVDATWDERMEASGEWAAGTAELTAVIHDLRVVDRATRTLVIGGHHLVNAPALRLMAEVTGNGGLMDIEANDSPDVRLRSRTMIDDPGRTIIVSVEIEGPGFEQVPRELPLTDWIEHQRVRLPDGAEAVVYRPDVR